MPAAQASPATLRRQKVVFRIVLKLHFAWHPSCAWERGYHRAILSLSVPDDAADWLAPKEKRMAGAPQEKPKMKPTLGLTGVTVNAMALIAPGAFLWITFVVQAGYA